MDQILVEVALDGRIRYAIGALAGLGFAMVGFALAPQFFGRVAGDYAPAFGAWFSPPGAWDVPVAVLHSRPPCAGDSRRWQRGLRPQHHHLVAVLRCI